MAKSTSPIWFSIPEFLGIQQNKDGRLLPIGTAYDARNIDTSDGNLRVAEGFMKVTASDSGCPGSDTIKKLIPAYGESTAYDFYVVTNTTIYRRARSSYVWSKVPDDDTNTDFVFDIDMEYAIIDVLRTRIGNDDVALICTANQPMVVLDMVYGRARSFGSGLIYKPLQSNNHYVSYDPSTRLLTMDVNWDAKWKNHALTHGIVYGPNTFSINFVEVESAPSANTLILKQQPSVSFASGDLIWPAGSSSDAKVGTAVMYAGRLFTAGEALHDIRLYWSAVPGDGRTIEDWAVVDGSDDASGGFVDVGYSSSDRIIGLTALSNQLVIWKRYSTWRLLGDRPSTFTVERVCKNPVRMPYEVRPITYHDAPYFLTTNGIQTYDTVSIVPLDADGNRLKNFLPWLYDRSFTYSRSTIHNNRFYFSCKDGTGGHATYDDSLVVFDPARGTYMIRDGFKIADIVSDGEYLFLINGDRQIYKFDASATLYGTQKIHAYWQTQPIDFGRKMYRHQLMGLYMQLAGGDMKVTVYGDYDGSTKSLIAKKDDTRKGYIAVRVQTDQSNELSFTFSNKTGTNTYTNFAVLGGINIKALSELKE